MFRTFLESDDLQFGCRFCVRQDTASRCWFLSCSFFCSSMHVTRVWPKIRPFLHKRYSTRNSTCANTNFTTGSPSFCNANYWHILEHDSEKTNMAIKHNHDKELCNPNAIAPSQQVTFGKITYGCYNCQGICLDRKWMALYYNCVIAHLCSAGQMCWFKSIWVLQSLQEWSQIISHGCVIAILISEVHDPLRSLMLWLHAHAIDLDT